jgi:uncharacterized membrane protein
VTVLVDVGPSNVAQVSMGGELLGAATPHRRGGLRVLTVAGREIGTTSGYQAAGELLARHAGCRRPRIQVRDAAQVSGARR